MVGRPRLERGTNWLTANYSEYIDQLLTGFPHKTTSF